MITIYTDNFEVLETIEDGDFTGIEIKVRGKPSVRVRSLYGGRFSAKVPVDLHDGVAREFNEDDEGFEAPTISQSAPGFTLDADIDERDPKLSIRFEERDAKLDLAIEGDDPLDTWIARRLIKQIRRLRVHGKTWEFTAEIIGD